MKVRCSREFTWRHDAKEEYSFSSNPIEITDEAFAHVQRVFGKEMFEVVPEGAQEKVSEPLAGETKKRVKNNK